MIDLSSIDSKNIKGVIRKDYSLSGITYMKTGGTAEMFFKPYSDSDIINMFKIIDKNVPVNIIGACSNTLIRDGNLSGLTIKLGRSFNFIKKIDDYRIHVGCGTMDKTIADFAANNSIGSLEFLATIPGTLGGAISMNAGAHNSETKNIIESIRAIDRNGNIYTIKNQEIGFQYRKTNIPKDLLIIDAIVFGAKDDQNKIFEKISSMQAYRNKTQPSMTQKTLGCTFKNPSKDIYAWQLISSVNEDKLKFGGAYISEKHSNFIINDGTATSNDIERLCVEIKNRVKDKFNITLETEIAIIGNN